MILVYSFAYSFEQQLFFFLHFSSNLFLSSRGKAGFRTRKKPAPRKKSFQEELKERFALMNLRKEEDATVVDEDDADHWKSPGK